MSSELIRILHTNDFHGRLDARYAEKLKPIRESHDYWFDSGDAVKAGNLSIPFWQEEVWTWFEQLGLTAMCPGNRESHVWGRGVEAKFRGSTAPILCANWKTRDGSLVWRDSLILEHGRQKIGVFGVMVPMVTERMKTQALSAYLWDQPIEAAKKTAASLKRSCHAVIALTHIGISQDRVLAETSSHIDLILGGHSHTMLNSVELVNGVVISQQGSHGRAARSISWSVEDGLVEESLIVTRDP